MKIEYNIGNNLFALLNNCTSDKSVIDGLKEIFNFEKEKALLYTEIVEAQHRGVSTSSEEIYIPLSEIKKIFYDNRLYKVIDPLSNINKSKLKKDPFGFIKSDDPHKICQL